VKPDWKHPYGDGKTAQTMVKILKEYILPDMISGEILNARAKLCFSPFLMEG
jgi:hypothetical protein